jgi:hypothetical protein
LPSETSPSIHQNRIRKPGTDQPIWFRAKGLWRMETRGNDRESTRISREAGEFS